MKEISEANPNNATFREYWRKLTTSQAICWTKRRPGGALEDDRRAQEIFKELHDADPSNDLAVENLAFNYLSVGEILVRQSRIAQGLQNIRAALAMVQGIGAPKSLAFDLVESVVFRSWHGVRSAG